MFLVSAQQHRQRWSVSWPTNLKCLGYRSAFLGCFCWRQGISCFYFHFSDKALDILWVDQFKISRVSAEGLKYIFKRKLKNMCFSTRFHRVLKIVCKAANHINNQLILHQSYFSKSSVMWKFIGIIIFILYSFTLYSFLIFYINIKT